MTTRSSSDSAVDVGRLDQRVSSLESGQNAIMAKLDGLSGQLAERGRTPWALIVSIVGTAALLVSAIGGLAYSPLVSGQQRLEAALAVLSSEFKAETRAVADTFVSRSDFTTILASVKDRRDDSQRVTEDRFKRNEADVDNLQKAVVPRGEIEERWAGQRAHDADVQRQLDDLRKQNQALYGPRDELGRLSREVEDLQHRGSRSQP